MKNRDCTSILSFKRYLITPIVLWRVILSKVTGILLIWLGFAKIIAFPVFKEALNEWIANHLIVTSVSVLLIGIEILLGLGLILAPREKVLFWLLIAFISTAFLFHALALGFGFSGDCGCTSGTGLHIDNTSMLIILGAFLVIHLNSKGGLKSSC